MHLHCQILDVVHLYVHLHYLLFVHLHNRITFVCAFVITHVFALVITNVIFIRKYVLQMHIHVLFLL